VKEIRVKRIKNGTVIDHITGGQAFNVLRIMGLRKGYPRTTLTVAMNVPSKKLGFKDIVKVEGKEIKKEEVDKIALIAPETTINIIREREVIKKEKVNIPLSLEGVLRCANPNCITRFEDAVSKFIVEEKCPIKLRCSYCERVMSDKDIVRLF